MYNRRKFIKNTALTGAGIALLSNPILSFASIKKEKINVAIIGVGARGKLHLEQMLKRNDVNVIAIADPDEHSISRAQEVLAKYGKSPVKAYNNGPNDYKRLLDRKDIDSVIIASPWEWHIPQALYAMQNKIAVGLEVSGALQLQDCWDIVNAYEKTKIPVMILENVCYRRDIMAVLNMVRQGLFEDVLHVEGGYQHDLRAELFNTADKCCSGVTFGPTAKGSAKWRTEYYVKENEDNYPTHGLGPVAMMIDINRGNRLTKLSSIATPAKGFNRYVAKNPLGGPNSPNAKLKFKQGDIVTTQIQTHNGQTIVITLSTSSPRPYNLGFKVQGTNGLWQEFSAGEFDKGLIYFEDKSPAETWENPKKYMEQYDHPLWKKYANEAVGSGHGGMDFFVDNAFVECIKRNINFPLDVYDLATWYSITPISRTSIAQGGTLQDIPDFTKGAWKTRKNTFALNDDY